LYRFFRFAISRTRRRRYIPDTVVLFYDQRPFIPSRRIPNPGAYADANSLGATLARHPIVVNLTINLTKSHRPTNRSQNVFSSATPPAASNRQPPTLRLYLLQPATTHTLHTTAPLLRTTTINPLRPLPLHPPSIPPLAPFPPQPTRRPATPLAQPQPQPRRRRRRRKRHRKQAKPRKATQSRRYNGPDVGYGQGGFDGTTPMMGTK
jgi:hypothetical protein